MRDLQDVFGSRAFRLFSIGNFSSLAAIWLVRVCIGWVTWELTRSKTWLGIMAFAELGPSVIISLYAGALADRYDRLKILRFGQGIQTVLALALVALSASGHNSVWWMLLILFGFSIIGGINLPARLSVAPSLVRRDQLATASAVGSITLNITRLLGPLIAAPLLVLNHEPLAFLLAAAGFGLNSFCLSRVRPEEGAAASVAPNTAGDGVPMLDVLRQMFSQPLLGLVLAIQFAVSLLVRPLTDMFPAFADVIFNRSEVGYAALNGVVGVGAIVGALFVVGEAAGRAMRIHLLLGSAIFAGTMIVFGTLSNFWAALLVLLVFGATMTASGIAGTTFVQVHTPMERLGRVMSVYSVIFRLAPALGSLGLGMLADAAGLRMAVVALPAIALVFLALIWRRFLAQSA